MMKWEDYNPRAFWNQRFRRYGHTGDVNSLIYRYDQPQRLRLIDKALSCSKVRINADTRILDIGCGSGDLISLFLKKGVLDITGIDFSDEVISYTRGRFSTNSNVKLFTMEVENMGFPTSSFDLVTSINVLQHIIPDEETFFRAIKNMVRVAKFGGHILTMDFSPIKVKDRNPASYLVIRSKMEYVEIFKNNGCSLIGEYGLPRIGVRFLSYISRVTAKVAKLMPKPKTETVERTTVRSEPAKITLKFQLYNLVRVIVLKLAKPFDYFLMPFPYRHTDMGILIFEKAMKR